MSVIKNEKQEKAHYLVLWHNPKVSCQEQTLNVVVCSFIQQIWNPGINLGTVEAAVNKTLSPLPMKLPF